MNNEEMPLLAHRQHVKYFMRFLNVLPSSLSSHDTTRVTIAYFSVAGLDVLGAIPTVSLELRSRIIEWIYLLQVPPNKESGFENGLDLQLEPIGGVLSIRYFAVRSTPDQLVPSSKRAFPSGTEDPCCSKASGDMSSCGFQGSSTVNIELDSANDHYKCGHLAMTYTGLCILLALGDDLSRINRKALVAGVKALQTEEGNFSATLSGCESDMRFVYCAACISYILDDWSGFDVGKATDYILKSINYDSGIAQCPELESHGGTTFCALATLSLTNQLDKLSEYQIEGLKRWLLFRQVDGFQGRPNKSVDTCYSFWVGASLKILDILHMTNYASNRKYVYETQDCVVGGFSKWPDTCTDPMHTYLGLAGLSLIGENGLLEIIPTLNITNRAFEHLKTIHERWAAES